MFFYEIMKPRIVAIVQARTGSTRLPNKVLMEISEGKSLVEYLLLRLKRSNLLDDIVVATSDKESDKKIIKIAEKVNVKCFTGSESDVLARFLGAAEYTKADFIVRICGDQPLIDPEIVDLVIKSHFKTKADYSSTMLKRTFPTGVDAEVFSFKILKEIEKLSKGDTYCREHITPYIYQHPEKFKLNGVMANDGFFYPDLKLTVDTIEDFEFVKKIICELSKKNKFISAKDAIQFVKESKSNI